MNDYDVAEFLHRLCERCVELFGVASAGVTVAAPNGGLGMAAASEPSVEHIERLQIQTGEGPCIEAYRSGVQLMEQDLRGNGLRRWPRFAAAAMHDGGPAAAFAFPMRLRDQRLGSLNLFRDVPGPFDQTEAPVAQALADVATIGILQARAINDARTLAAQLQHALDSRVLVEQAKGMVAERGGFDVRAAFDELRRYARRNARPLRDVAADVVAGALVLPEP